MAVRIGHASIDENGNATGGKAGDQTGKELCTRDWYTKGWNVLLRPVRADLAEKSAQAMEAACRNELIGYDQSGRNTLYQKAKAADFRLGDIDTACECDCSSLVHTCAIAGGANLTYGSNGHTTRTMVREFINSGDYVKLTDSKYLTSDKYLQRGDILVKEGSHTAMVLTNGIAVSSSDLPVAMPLEDNATIYYSVRVPLLQKGMERDAVKTMQHLMFYRGYDLPRTGTFDEETALAVMQFQKDMNLETDGKCGVETWNALLRLTGVG